MLKYISETISLKYTDKSHSLMITYLHDNVGT